MRDTQLAGDVERLGDSVRGLPEPVAEPALVVISGLPGTGKSYFSKRLADRLPFVILESDALRAVLFPTPSYTWRESARLFRAIHLLIENLLKKGIPIILDATNLSERNREYLYSIADRLNAKLLLVRVEAPAEIVKERLGARGEGAGSKSEADWKVYQKMKTSVEKIRRQHYVVDTSGDITPVLDKIVREVRR